MNATLFETSTDMRGALAPKKRRAYALAGKATITIRSAKTGTRFTYKISKSDDGKLWFVGLLTGPDNTSDYQYLGIIVPKANGAVDFRLTQKSRVGSDALSVRAMLWLMANWESEQMEVWHEGSCGRCGRKLTVPESIASGIGPTCAGRE